MKLTAAVFVLLSPLLAFSQAAIAHPGRYQLLAVKAPGISTGGNVLPYDEVLLCDTATGRVWKYAPGGEKVQVVANDPTHTATIGAGFDELPVEHLGNLKDRWDYALSVYQLAHPELKQTNAPQK